VRLFVAAELEPAAAAALADLSATLRRRAERLAPRAKLTWIPAERLHLTIRFIGELNEAVAAQVRGVLAEPLALAPFTLTLDALGVFPPKGPARVVWAGIGTARESLIAAEHEVSARLEACGIPREPRPYSPHLTLARVRDAAGLRSGELLADHKGTGLSEDQRRVSSRVDAITLFQSRLSPKGPTYVALMHTPLRG
jgi:2'-5' RNA ligase